MFDVYSGLRGSGKSYHAVLTAYNFLKAGKKVWVNFRVDFRKDFPKLNHDNCRLFETLDDLAYMRDGLMIFDEAHWKLSSREWKDLTPAVHQYISMSRHLHMDLILVTQDFNRLDSIARELTEIVVEHHQIGGRFDDRKGTHRAPWLMWYKEFLPKTVDKLKRKSIWRKYYRFDKRIGHSYNTDELFGELLKTLPPKEFPPSYVSNLMPGKILTSKFETKITTHSL